jgi:hypothetical protein
MMKTSEQCDDRQRRQAIRDHTNHGHHDLNGIDYVEVSDDQLTLTVYFLRKAPRHIVAQNVQITGGRRITDIKVRAISVCRVDDQELDDCMQVQVDKYGDFSTYTLCLVELDERGRPTDQPMRGFDLRYVCVEFSFKAGCPSDLDCANEPACPLAALVEPEISYLAKDYSSFRQLMLDRLALIMPDWQERHIPDLGIMLVELLAYVGDHLSYYQDAVATEAYITTARQRISVRRHARLVDYTMHEGCNARAWVFVETIGSPPALDASDICFITGHNNALTLNDTILSPDDLRNTPASSYDVFEPMTRQSIRLYDTHNTIRFYTWGDRECCLPRGTTSATLRDEWVTPPQPEPEQPGNQYQGTPGLAQAAQPGAQESGSHAKQRALDHLRVGEVLIFEELRDPKTAKEADANPLHRHAVRLTRVTRGIDALYKQPIIEIEWALEDALPFPLCLSVIGPPPECDYLEDISVARGNIILVDHGRTIGRIILDEQAPEPLGQVPIAETRVNCEECGCLSDVEIVPGRFRPRLKKVPLTFAESLPAKPSAAAKTLNQVPRNAGPQITDLSNMLSDGTPGHQWTAVADLLGSQGDAAQYVVEIDDDGRAHLRFGDGDLGRVPEAGSSFTALYRIGNGPAGNVGADAISHIVLNRTHLSGVTLRPRNPLPSQGGTLPEPIEEAKLFAPSAFRSELKRAITADDYARLAGELDARVQRAAAILRWTGSWYEVLVAIDPKGQAEADTALLRDITKALRPYRRIGHDLLVVKASYVALDVGLYVCVKPNYLRGHVKAALLERFSNRLLPGDQRGFFHPDNLSFGEGIALSKLVAIAQAVPGVENVIVKQLRRYQEDDRDKALENGFLPIGPLEVARLDNDPGFPENGVLKLETVGGR